jgi:hypothetical protein
MEKQREARAKRRTKNNPPCPPRGEYKKKKDRGMYSGKAFMIRACDLGNRFRRGNNLNCKQFAQNWTFQFLFSFLYMKKKRRETVSEYGRREILAAVGGTDAGVRAAEFMNDAELWSVTLYGVPQFQRYLLP